MCNTIFSHSDRLPKTSVPTKIISLCFDLYMKGLSYKLIKQHLKEQHNIRITHVTIYYWIQNYTKIIKKYLDTLQPDVSSMWQLDETFIQFKGIHGTKAVRSNGNWCWIAIDCKTRFVMTTHMDLTKDTYSCDEFFKKLEKYDSIPRVISTDGNKAYRVHIERQYPGVKHLITKNRFIERFNATIKNRTKTMRCFDEFDSCQTTMEAFRIYYNFLRPHTALDDRTPAEAAGLCVDVSERWGSLIKAALLV